MSRASNDNGRAYEYACVIALHEAVKQHRTIQIVQNSSLEVSKSAWDKMSKQQQELYQLSAASVTSTIFAMEPNILEVSSDTLDIYIQSDQEGQEADVRDIILRRNDIVWEIGLSVKHNHLAIKHSRIARSLDFGKKWCGVLALLCIGKRLGLFLIFLKAKRSKEHYLVNWKTKTCRYIYHY